MRLGRGCLLLLLTFLFAEAQAQTGSVAEVPKDGQISVVWDGISSPPAGSLGTVEARNRFIAVFRVLSSSEQGSTIQLVDVVMPDMVKKGQKIKLLELEPSSSNAQQASLVVWSDRSGGSFQVDGNPTGQVPSRVVLQPGAHEILLDLPDGGKAGAKIEVKPGEDTFVCPHGRSAPSPKGEDGYSYFIPLRSFETLPGQPVPLLWLEDRKGQRVYASTAPIKYPVLKKKVMPKYPEPLRLKRQEGRVILDALIGTDGRVKQLDAIVGPDPEFRQAAEEAVLKWKYEPASLDGRPVNVFYTIIVDFYLASR